MKTSRFLFPMLAAVLALGALYALGVPMFSGDAGTGLTALGLGMAEVAAVALPWGRVRKDLPQFDQVPTTGLATCVIPRNGATLLGISLKYGGTTFNESKITGLVLRLGSKVIWKCTGAHLRLINAFKGYYDGNRQFQYIDFTAKGSKNLGGEFVGGIDMTKLPKARLALEVTTSGATAPTMTAKGHWGAVQDNSVMQRLLQFTWSATAAGRRVVPLDFGGARLRNLFFIDASGTDWMQTATATAWATNTAGGGAMGAITVAAGTKVGTWKLTIVEPAANAGTFVLEDPDGNIIGVKGAVAGAYSGGGLGFTLADATDYVSGDGFDIVVSENDTGNVQRVEVIKNGESVWDFLDPESRNLQKQYGFVPQSRVYPVTFEMDGWPDGSLPTADATTLEIAVTVAAAVDFTIYAEVLDTPENPLN